MTTFEPIIGSGFDQIAAQRQFWNGFNRQTEEGNIARAKQAQDEINRYNFAVSEAARQDAANEMRARQDAMNRAVEMNLGAADRARHNYEWSSTEKRLTDEEARRSKAFEFQKSEKEKADKLTSDLTERTATNLAPQTMDAAAKVKEYEKLYQDKLSEAQTILPSLQQELRGKAMYDPKLKAFKAITDIKNPDATAANTAAADEANNRLAAAFSDAEKFGQTYNAHLSNFQTLLKSAQQYGLQVNNDGTVFSPLHNKSFGVPKKEDVATPPQTDYSMPFSFQSTEPIQRQAISFGDGNQTYDMGITPAPVARIPSTATDSSLRVGKYLVTPE